METTSKRIFATFLIAVSVLVISVAFFIYQIKTRPKPKSRPPRTSALIVEVMSAQPRKAEVTVRGFGAAEAKSSLNLVAQVSGRITYLNPDLRAGASLRKEALLVRIDPRPYEIAIERSKAAISQATANLERLRQEEINLKNNLQIARREVDLAQRSLERAKNLLQTGAGSEGQRDTAEQALLTQVAKTQSLENSLAIMPQQIAGAQATLQQNQAALHDAELKLEYTQIRAPFNCRVTDRSVEPGQFVGVGTPLAEIYDPEVLEIPLRIALRDMAWIPKKKGFEKATAPAARAYLRLTNQQYCVWQGHLSRIDNRIDERSRTAGVIVEVSDTNATTMTIPGPARYEQLAPGTFLEVEVDGRAIDNAFVLPRKVLTPGDEVLLYDAGKLEIRPVQVARSDASTAYVTDGLEAGEQIVLTTIAAPIDGMPLRLNGNDGPTTGTQDQSPRSENRDEASTETAPSRQNR